MLVKVVGQSGADVVYPDGHVDHCSTGEVGRLHSKPGRQQDRWRNVSHDDGRSDLPKE